MAPGATNGYVPTDSVPQPKVEPGFKLGDFSIDEDRPMKVVVIGAGFSGINAAIR